MGQLPSGTVTFLFTDIEGSTRLWQQYPAAMPAALARHHALLNEMIAAHGGYVFQIIGDAFCAAFSTATDGLQAALAAQRALRDEPWGETGPIRVRMALHTGAAEARAGEYTSGEYVSGLTLSRAARLLSAGHGEQILLSLPAAELARDHLPQDTTLRDMGARRLKDLIRPEQIFQVVAADLPADLPPLKTLDVYRHNLPVQLTSFVGREREMSEIKRLLSGAHLLTLTGAGGTGKTRLSLQVAADLIDEFPDGVWFVELAPLTDPALIPHTAASVLGLREEAGRPMMTVLSDSLRAKTTLLVLDNCEHLIDACAEFAGTVLRAAPKAKILATSREALGIAGETAYRVPSLSLPPTDLQSLEDFVSLSQYEAVRLFIDRALAVQPDFSVTNANAPAVAQICHRLDGIPLAIELAAARVRVLSIAQIAARLDDRFSLLTGGSRTALPRHRTLRATIEWSYDLLSGEEQVLFQRLAIFAGGWTLDAVESVCVGNGLAQGDVLDVLTRLVDKSIVIVERDQDEGRYRMLETIRQYAHERLTETGHLPMLQSCHLDCFLQLAEEACPRAYEGNPVWLDCLEIEYDNLRAALEHALATDVELALRLAMSLDHFWLWHNHLTEGHAWATRLLPLTEAWEPGKLRARALGLAGSQAFSTPDDALARPLLEASLAMARMADDKYQMALSLSGLLWSAYEAGEWAQARRYAEEDLALFQELGIAWGVVNYYWISGMIASGSGDYELARSYFEQTLELARSANLPGLIVVTLNQLGDLALRRGDYASAGVLFAECARRNRHVKLNNILAASLVKLGQVALHEGDHVRARPLFQEALTFYRQLELGDCFVMVIAGLAGVAGVEGKHLLSARLFGSVQAIYEAQGWEMTPAARALYDHIIAGAREQLDEATFNTAWAEGRTMTREQAIEYALENVKP